MKKDRNRVLEILDEAKALFEVKNKSYSTRRTLDHFARALPVVTGEVSAIQYVWILASKQDMALAESMHAKKEGKLCREQRENLRERLLDGIVYRAILLAMLEQEKTIPSR